MALRSKKQIEAVEAPMQEVAASSYRLTSMPPVGSLGSNSSINRNYADETWQRELWRFYDCGGELHFAADYVGSACSLVRLYIAEVDEYGVMQGEVENDPEVGAIAQNIFGGPAAKAEILRQLGIALTVAGDTWLIGRERPPGGGDRWTTVAPYMGRRWGNDFRVNFGDGATETVKLGGGTANVVTRVWTPHPERPVRSDSPAHALLLEFSQLERLRIYLNAQIDSRLYTAMIQAWPMLDFPQDDAMPSAGESVMQKMFESVSASISNPGQAGHLSPIFVEMPLEELKAMNDNKPLSYESPLSEQAIDLRKELRVTIQEGMNLPATFFDGNRNTNHWAAWWGSEEFATKSVSPIMNRIVDALTTSILYGALRQLGKDPARYTFWYDLAPLFNSADRLTDALNLGAQGYISDADVRAAGNYNESAAPSQHEKDVKYLRELTLRNPLLFELPEVRKFLGFDIPELMPITEGSVPPPPPPRPDRVIAPQPIGSKPEQPNSFDENALTAAIIPQPSAVLTAANATVVRALELAGKRLVGQKHQTKFPNTAPHNYHTVVKVGGHEHAEQLLASAWSAAPAFFEGVDVAVDAIVPMLNRYAQDLMVGEIAHSSTYLARFLGREGVR